MKSKPLTKSKYDYPPRQRRLMVHSWFIILFGIMAAAIILMSCTPKHGCYGTRGIRGYSWLKCIETKKVFVLDKDGAIICAYIDSNNKP